MFVPRATGTYRLWTRAIGDGDQVLMGETTGEILSIIKLR